MSRNLVVLVGRLAAEPALRYLPSGTAVTNFAVAVNRTIRKPEGGFEDSLDGFFDCELFGGLAEVVAETLKKGSDVQLTGYLLQKKFEGKDGSVSKVEIRVRTIGAPLQVPRQANAPSARTEPVGQPA